jgi:DNA-binding NtrC family response regulator
VRSTRSKGNETAEVLRGLSVLVVEDEFLLLSELEAVLLDAGADAVHACRTLPEATSTLDNCEVAAAILDVRIGRESVAPVARKLASCKTPFLFYTGQSANDPIMQEWTDHPVLSKPAAPQRIISTLADLLLSQKSIPQHCDM